MIQCRMKSSIPFQTSVEVWEWISNFITIVKFTCGIQIFVYFPNLSFAFVNTRSSGIYHRLSFVTDRVMFSFSFIQLIFEWETRQMKTQSNIVHGLSQSLLVTPWPVVFPHKGPVMRNHLPVMTYLLTHKTSVKWAHDMETGRDPPQRASNAKPFPCHDIIMKSWNFSQTSSRSPFR